MGGRWGGRSSLRLASPIRWQAIVAATERLPAVAAWSRHSAFAALASKNNDYSGDIECTCVHSNATCVKSTYLIAAKSVERRDIRRLRGSLGLTQAEFGQVLNAHACTVSRWEKGHQAPDPWQARLIQDLTCTARQAPERADEARELLLKGMLGAALAILLGAALAAVSKG